MSRTTDLDVCVRDADIDEAVNFANLNSDYEAVGRSCRMMSMARCLLSFLERWESLVLRCGPGLVPLLWAL